MDEQAHVTPQGLSMSRDGKELLVICEHPKIGNQRTQELRFLGDDEIGPFPRKEIVAKRIDLSHIEHFLLQAVELADDHFAISQVRTSQNMHRIILIDKSGKLLSSFGSAIVPENIRFPWSLHVDLNNMLIASHCDCDPDSDPNSVDNRILVLQVLDGQLEYCRDLISKHDAWMADIALYPRRLFFDEARGIMYVASGWKGGPYGKMYGNFSVWDVLQRRDHTLPMSASSETTHSHIQPSVHEPSVHDPSVHEPPIHEP